MALVDTVSGTRLLAAVVACAVLSAGCQGARSAADELARLADDAVRGGDDVSRYLDDAAQAGRGSSDEFARQWLDDVQNAASRYQAVPEEWRATACAVVTDWWRAELSGDPDATAAAVQAVASTAGALNVTVGAQGLATDLQTELTKFRNGEDNTLDVLLLSIAVCEAAS